jgi:ABC-type transport system substrate-binding protein
LLLLALLAGAGCKRTGAWERGRKVLHVPLRARVATFEPTRANAAETALAQAQVYETLLTFAYLVRPLTLEPLLARAMPEVSDDGLTYTFSLRPGVRFHDDPCFAASGGKGRELVAQDLVYSLKRLADRDNAPLGWWLLQERIEGLDAFRERMNARPAGARFDWDAPVAGLRALDRYRLQIRLTRPYPQLLYVLAMEYTAAVPRECAEYHGATFASHPVGTGPFRLRSWVRGSKLVFERNRTYRDARYPTRASDELRARGLLAAAGQRIPFLDGLVLHEFEADEPMWLQFRAGDLDIVQVPPEYRDLVFTGERRLRPAFAHLGHAVLPLYDLIYRGFNMEDPVVGGRDARGRKLRQAIAMALDGRELNDTFYAGDNVLFAGPVPPGLDGHRPGLASACSGPDLQRAGQLLAEAGYPGGRGLSALQYHTHRGASAPEQSEMMARQLRRIGITLEVHVASFPELSERLGRKKAQLFGLAWLPDYPDAENFLQMFYGPNEAPGANYFNYKNDAYDALYRRASVMLPSPERTRLYQQMVDLLVADCPQIGSMSRTRFYLWQPRVRNLEPAEMWKSWLKYLDVPPRS